MGAKKYSLSGEGNRFYIIEYEDGRLFFSTPLGAMPITRQEITQLAGCASGLVLVLAFRAPAEAFAKEMEAIVPGVTTKTPPKSNLH